MCIKNKFKLLCALMFLIGCSSTYDVSYDYRNSINFNDLKTYDWSPISKKKRLDQLTIERIKKAVNSNLNGKGLKQDSVDPDFLIEIIFGEKQKKARRSRYRYLEGYLSIDFVEPNAKSLIWHGSAKAELEYEYNPERSDNIINEVVNKILSSFPPPTTK